MRGKVVAGVETLRGPVSTRRRQKSKNICLQCHFLHIKKIAL